MPDWLAYVITALFLAGCAALANLLRDLLERFHNRRRRRS